MKVGSYSCSPSSFTDGADAVSGYSKREMVDILTANEVSGFSSGEKKTIGILI